MALNQLGLEKRMFFLTMYNISPIQQGIQCGHAALEYAHKYKDDPEFIDFVENWKTWVILNGGTSTSLGYGGPGSMERHLDTIRELGIKHATFNEPDLNYSLSAICFISNESVFARKEYPYFEKWVRDNYSFDSLLHPLAPKPDGTYDFTPGSGLHTAYIKYCEFMGGEQTIKVRAFLDQFRLA